MSFVFLNGKYIAETAAKISINDHGFLYGDGVYETMRTYNDKVWLLEEHLERLFNSAKMLNLEIPWTKKQIKNWIYELIDKNRELRTENREEKIKIQKTQLSVPRLYQFGQVSSPPVPIRAGQFYNFRIRLTITRGNNDFDFFTTKNPTILITTQELIDDEQTKGLKLISFQGERTVPQAKHLSQIINIIARQNAHKQKADDAVFVDESDYISECAFSNIFIVKNGILKTPRLENILSGITRKYILSFANKILPTKECKITLKELYEADEVFLSVTTRAILWVAKIDGYKIGDGKIGKFTQRIKKYYFLKRL